MEHEISVAKLRELLAMLEDDDVLIPNAVANLKIVRGDRYVGFINLLKDLQGVEMHGDSGI